MTQMEILLVISLAGNALTAVFLGLWWFRNQGGRDWSQGLNREQEDDDPHN